MLFTLIIIFSLLGSVGSISLAGLLLFLPGKTRSLLIPHLVSYASGTLLGAAFLGLIPHAMERSSTTTVLQVVLGGIILFFILEKLILWHHCHEEVCEVHGTAGPILLIGDGLHNFLDGVIIAAAFVQSIPLGVATGIAVIAHEIPQEVGDFAVLLDSGYQKRRAFLYNTLSGLTTVIGAVTTYLFIRYFQAYVPYIMALSASSFIYIATVDLIPALHRRTSFSEGMRQLLLLLAGVGTIAIFHLNK